MMERNSDAPSCGVGHPIYPATGAKGITIELGNWLGIQISMAYNSKRQLPLSDGSAMPARNSLMAEFDGQWALNIFKGIVIGGNSLQAYRGNERAFSFTKAGSGSNGVIYSSNNPAVVDVFTGQLYYDLANGAVEQYYSDSGSFSVPYNKIALLASVDGLLNLTYSSAWVTTYAALTRQTMEINSITDRWGRSMNFAYTAPSNSQLMPRLSSISSPQGGTIQFGYDDQDRLSTIK